jgi:hypothetical protein
MPKELKYFTCPRPQRCYWQGTLHGPMNLHWVSTPWRSGQKAHKRACLRMLATSCRENDRSCHIVWRMCPRAQTSRDHRGQWYLAGWLEMVERTRPTNQAFIGRGLGRSHDRTGMRAERQVTGVIFPFSFFLFLSFIIN